MQLSARLSARPVARTAEFTFREFGMHLDFEGSRTSPREENNGVRDHATSAIALFATHGPNDYGTV